MFISHTYTPPPPPLEDNFWTCSYFIINALSDGEVEWCTSDICSPSYSVIAKEYPSKWHHKNGQKDKEDTAWLVLESHFSSFFLHVKNVQTNTKSAQCLVVINPVSVCKAAMHALICETWSILVGLSIPQHAKALFISHFLYQQQSVRKTEIKSSVVYVAFPLALYTGALYVCRRSCGWHDRNGLGN